MNTENYKRRLEEERRELIAELKEVGQINPDDPRKWEPTATAGDSGETADSNELADHMEEFEENIAIEGPLAGRLEEIDSALSRIQNGNYGICVVGGTSHPIEEERLEANPAANSCIEHKS